MKNTLFLLSAVCCLTLPAALRADDLGAPSKKTTVALAKAGLSARAAANRGKLICYVTDRPRTGSNIPMVYRQYNGVIDSASSPAVFGQETLRFSGSDDVAATLAKLDASITSTGRR